MSDELTDKPLSQLAAINSASELNISDLILISKKNDGEHENFLSRNMSIEVFETFTMSSYVNPALNRVSTDLYARTEECSSFLSNVIDNDVVHKKDANFSLTCPGTGYVTAVIQKDGILSAVSSDLEVDLNMSQYCKKKDLNNSAGRDGYYLAGFKQTDGYVTATLSGFAPLLSVYPTKKELNVAFNIPSKTTITSIRQSNGLLNVETVNSDFQLTAKDDEVIKSIAAAENGKLSATYKKIASYDFTPILYAYPTKNELNATFNIPSKTTITAIKQENGKLKVETVNSDFQLSAKDGEMIKSIAPAENGKLSATYKKLATCDVRCDETEYIRRIKLSEDDVQIEKAPHENIWPMRACLEAIYPVGAIYLATTSYCPLQNISGMSWRWVQVSQNRVLQGSNGTNTGKTIDAGLPNLYGEIGLRHTSVMPATNGVFQKTYKYLANNAHFGSCGVNAYYAIVFNASASNSIYGNSTTVQPPAYVVTVWERVS